MFHVRSALTSGAVQGGRVFWRRLVAKQPGWADAHSQGDGGVDRQRPQSVWSPQRDHRHCPPRPESHDRTERGQRPPHWAIFGCRVGGEGWGRGVTGKPWSHCTRSASTLGYSWGKRWGLGRRGDQKAMIALNEVCIHTGLQLGAEWKGGGTGGTGTPWSHWIE